MFVQAIKCLSIAAVVAVVIGAPAALAAPQCPAASIKIGESKVVGMVRHRNCTEAPAWDAILMGLPVPQYGKLQNGGKSQRKSRNCGRVVPVRVVRYVAIEEGAESLVIYDDPARVDVCQGEDTRKVRAKVANPVQKGLAAYQTGDYRTAVRLLRPAADEGDEKAQFVLGAMYHSTQIAPRDGLEEAKWYRWWKSPPMAQAPPYDLPDKPGLAMKVVGPRNGNDADTLVVLLHGDISGRKRRCQGKIRRADRKRCAADYMYRFATKTVRKDDGIAAAAIIRPGYYDTKNNHSPGDSHGHRDNGTPANNALITAQIRDLKDKFQAEKVVAIGHSGGARAVGAIIARAPGLIDLAVLVSCPCNISQWYALRGRKSWVRSESPSAFLTVVPRSTKVVAITGSKDDNTLPILAIDYVNALRARGVNARYVEVPGAGHHALDPLWSTIGKAIFNQIPKRPAYAGEFDELKERLKSGDEEFLKQWQTYFRGIGLYAGSIDGSYGRMTEAALSKCEAIDECRKGD